MRLLTTTLLTLVLTAACSSGAPTDFSSPPPQNQGIVAGEVTITAKRPQLTIRNGTGLTVGYLAVDENQVIIAMYPPCVTCTKLAPGGTVVIPYASIDGYTANSRVAKVLYWSYIPGPNGTPVASGPINTVDVRLN
jgi:hypothetical protein